RFFDRLERILVDRIRIDVDEHRSREQADGGMLQAELAVGAAEVENRGVSQPLLKKADERAGEGAVRDIDRGIQGALQPKFSPLSVTHKSLGQDGPVA